MLRVTALWTGFLGAPGYSNFYFGEGFDALVHTQTEAETVAGRVRTFFDGVKQNMPAAVKINVLPLVTAIDPATGIQEKEFNIAVPPAQVIGGQGTGSYAAPSGACINWRTSTFVAGKKLRGKTFLVPLHSAAFELDGSLSAATLALVQSSAPPLYAGNLGSGEALVVWHRPRNGAGGSVGKVTGHSITDKAAVLRSRRD